MFSSQPGRYLAIVVFAALAACNATAQSPSQGTYTIERGPADPYSGYLRAADNPNLLMQFTLVRDVAGFDTLDSFYFYDFSWGARILASDIEAMELWIDEDSDGVAGTGDVFLCDADLSTWDSDGYPMFKGIDLDIDQNQVTLLITVSINVNTPTGGSITPVLAQESFSYDPASSNPVGFLAYSQVYDINNPGFYWYYWDGSFSVISSYAPLALWGGYNVPAANVLKGAKDQPVLQFSLTQNSDGFQPTVSAINVTGSGNGHTAVVTDISSIRLYLEKGNANGLLDDVDTLVATGTRVGTTGFVFQFLCSLDVPDTGALNFLVVVDVAPTAGNNVIRLYTNRGSITHNGSPLWYGGVNQVLDEAQTITTPLAGAYLTIVTQPTDTAAGLPINGAPGVRIEARTSGGALYSAFAGVVKALVVTGPSATFTYGSSTSVLASGGVAIFVDLALPTVGPYTIKFTAAPLTDTPASSSFTITYGAAYKASISTQPSDGMIGVPIPPPPVVNIVDQYDNVVGNFNGRVTAALLSNPSGATLQNAQVFAVNGVATFSSLMIDKAGSGYSLLFSATGISSSGGSAYFAMAVGLPAQLVVVQQPGSVTGGATISPEPRVHVQDAGGNLVSGYLGNMTVSIGNNPSAGTLSGTLVIPVTGGTAQFNDLSINFAGVGYTLFFSIGGGGATGESAGFDISVGNAVKLSVTSQPTDTTGGMPFSPLVAVEVQDAGGNVIASDNTTTVTASITAGTGETGGELWGTLSLQVVAGVATFPDLAVNKCGPTPYTLTFDSNGPHTAAVSNAFVISLGPIATVGVATQPGLASYGSVFLQQPVAQIADLGGNLISSSTANIAVAIKSGSGTAGAMLSGTTSINAVGGVVTFTDLSIDFAGVDYVLVFTSSGLLDGLSQPFNVASPATHLSITVQPGTGQVGLLLLVQPAIEIRDDAETVVPDFFTLVTAEIAPTTGTPGASLLGTTQIYAAAGAVAFTNLQVDRPGKGYRLKFTSYPTLTQAFSDPFDVAGIPVKLNLARDVVGGSYPGEPLTIQPIVEVCDANDVRCIGENTIIVSAYITPATGTEQAILGGTNPLTVVNGAAVFTDLSIDRPGTAYTLSFATTPSLWPVHTGSFDIAGDVPPSQNADTDVVGGEDGGSCAAQAQGLGPWALLLMVVVGAVGTKKRYSRRM